MFDFLLHQQAQRGGQQVGHALGRGVGAVRGAEGVVDIDIAERGQLRGEGGVVGLFFGVEAQVFQQQHLARAERLRLPLRASAPTQSAREVDRHAGQQSLQVRGHRARGYTWGSPPLGRPRWVIRITAAPLSSRQPDRGQRGADARIVGDRVRLLVQRHVEIHTHQHALPGTSISCTVRLAMVTSARFRIQSSACWTVTRAFITKHSLLQPYRIRQSKLKPFFADKLRQVGDAAGIAPLVVVPGDDLDHVVAHAPSWTGRRRSRSAGRP